MTEQLSNSINGDWEDVRDADVTLPAGPLGDEPSRPVEFKTDSTAQQLKL